MNTPEVIKEILENTLQLQIPRRSLPHAVAATAAILSEACKEQSIYETAPIREQNATNLLTWERWYSLSPLEKVKYLNSHGLNKNNYQELTGFDPLQELTGSTARVYCNETICTVNPEEMAQNVYFVDPDTFIREVEQESKIKLSSQELEMHRKHTLEVATRDGKVFMNVRNIQLASENLKKAPRLPESLIGINIEAKTYESVLMHAFTHTNSIEEIREINPIRLNLWGEIVRFTEIDGFTFKGVGKTDGENYYINGANEAFTEYVAQYLVTKNKGVYVTFAAPYGEGAMLMKEINTRANISGENFIKYNNQLTIDTLLEKWGVIVNPNNPDKDAATKALMSIGLYVNGITSLSDARQDLQIFLSPR